jgi:anthranilate phosphoribosyltransferase
MTRQRGASSPGKSRHWAHARPRGGGIDLAVSAVLDSLLTQRKDLTAEQARELCDTMLDGALSDAQIARLLVKLAEKGETPEELFGFVGGILSRAEPVPYAGPTIDTCGTGGSGLVRFNVSTAVAFVLAACGLCVAKHGNRGSRARNGSFDLLEALGVPIDLNGSAVATCLEQTGLAFIYARRFHPVMKRVATARELAGRRTIFNLAGPLSNPTRVQIQVVGTTTHADARRVASCLRLLGRQDGLCVTGHSGIDDVDLSGPATVHDMHSESAPREVDPASLGLSTVSYAELPGGDAQTNAGLFLHLLDGTAPSSLRELVCLSAALVLVTARRVTGLREGIELARDALVSRSVRDKFEQYRDVARRASQA